MTTPAYLLRFAALATANVALSVLALERLWFWFVVPLGVMELGYLHALGLRFTVFLFTAGGAVTPPPPSIEADRDTRRRVHLSQQAEGVLLSGVVLLIAWGIR